MNLAIKHLRAYASIRCMRTSLRCPYSQHKQPNEENDRAQKLKELQFRKKLIEDNKIKAMNDRIRTTKGNFNPLLEYAKLYRYNLIYLALAAFATFLGTVAYSVTGVQSDPFTGKKKFILISEEFERSLDLSLRYTFVSQFKAEEGTGSNMQKQSQQLQKYLGSKTGREYKIVLVQAESPTIVILPRTIVLSKNMILGKNKRQDVEHLLLLMETLFAKRMHIKDLAISNMLAFIRHRVKPGNMSDIAMVKIYSRPYSSQEIDEAAAQIQQSYSIPPSNILHSFSSVVTKYSSPNSSPFSLQARIVLEQKSSL